MRKIKKRALPKSPFLKNLILLLYKKRVVLLFYTVVLILFSIYSYALVDLNLTLLNHKVWEVFRQNIIQIGYFQRSLSLTIYLLLAFLLFLFNLLITKLSFKPLKIALLTGIVLLFSYPFLSHDFFNYVFDAKILTFYHQNPYLYKALDFPADPYLRFMHWTHRTYPYGPVWLILTLPFSFLSFGKFILNFLSFKFLFFLLYFGSVFILAKMDEKKALFFATNPLVLVEGLISPHNDLAAVFFGLLFIYGLERGKVERAGRFLSFLFSVLIKYTTIFLAIFFLPLKKELKLKISFFLLLVILIFLVFKNDLYPWYFLNFFLFLPFLNKKAFTSLSFASLILGLTYSPFILFGQWNQETNMMRNYIFLAGSLILIGFIFIRRKARFL